MFSVDFSPCLVRRETIILFGLSLSVHQSIHGIQPAPLLKNISIAITNSRKKKRKGNVRILNREPNHLSFEMVVSEKMTFYKSIIAGEFEYLKNLDIHTQVCFMMRTNYIYKKNLRQHMGINPSKLTMTLNQ